MRDSPDPSARIASGASGAPIFDGAERRVVHFTGFAHAATHYVELVYPTLAVGLAAEVGLPLEEVLGWSFASYLLLGLGALPAGYAADRLGSRPVILAGLMMAGASCLLAALSAPGLPLALCLAGLGLGASCYHPAGMGLLSRTIRARGRALGINGIYGNVGIAIAPLATAALVARFGWRLTFAITGGLLIAGTLAFAGLRIRERAALEDVSEATGAEPATELPVAKGRLVPAFVVLCVAATLGGFSYRGNTVAQPALFAERIHFMGYGLAASLAMLVGIAGQYLGGILADRYSLRWLYLGFHALSLPMVLVVAHAAGVPLLLGSGLFVFFALGMQPVENSLFAVLTPERWRGVAYGLKFVLTFGIGASAVPMVRWVAPSLGWSGVYLVLAGVITVLVSAIVVLIALTRRPSASAAPELAAIAPRPAPPGA